MLESTEETALEHNHKDEDKYSNKDQQPSSNGVQGIYTKVIHLKRIYVFAVYIIKVTKMIYEIPRSC